jgi:hypothetical protein
MEKNTFQRAEGLKRQTKEKTIWVTKSNSSHQTGPNTTEENTRTQVTRQNNDTPSEDGLEPLL